ncbi:MAG: hypothetical protein QNK31_09375 [Porticoccus sp.]|nr:hypothetical protein [Porticoccus sp.]
MTQPNKDCLKESSLEAGSSLGAEITPSIEAHNEKYIELLDSLLNDKKDVALKKHPELISAYKALEVYEIYFLAGGDWDETGTIEFKKKMAKTIVSKLANENDSPKPQESKEK